MAISQNEFLQLRKQVIQKMFGGLNEMQFAAVTDVNGPMLVLAGAGSGKTTMLVNRVACVLRFGNAYNSTQVPNYTDEDILAANRFIKGLDRGLASDAFGVQVPAPWQVLAITFTNKAAGEITDRLFSVVGGKAAEIWTGTFHSVCGRMLRRHAERIGYTSHFAIYDQDDAKRMMKDIYKKADIDEKMYPINTVLNEIGRAKDRLISAEEYAAQSGGNFRQEKVAKIYDAYSKAMLAANAMDFDDMIYNAVMLLSRNPDIAQAYSNQFRYIFVDEYQDTSHAQYMLVKLLAKAHRNVCVVGDDDQSIYRFRGATIENILNFEQEYKDSKVIRLEQNYRSTSNILNAANAVIANNEGRKGKNLWTDKGEGEKIVVHEAISDQEEARFVADNILEHVRNGGKFSDCAVLYRINALSRGLEGVFARSGIPYKIIGGHHFYDRKEIKDVLAYLCFASNPYDMVRLKRIINEPKRGIGNATVEKIAEICDLTGDAPLTVMENAKNYADISRAANPLFSFVQIAKQLIEAVNTCLPHELIDLILDITGYAEALRAQGAEGLDRLENVKELISAVLQYEKETEEPTVQGYLQDVALITDIDSYNADNDLAALMTVHSAKGLEFKNVFLVGMEENIFPSARSSFSAEDLEEERRLAYVAITRAKERLFITHTRSRMLFGSTTRNKISRFAEETPQEYCRIEKAEEPKLSFGGSLWGDGALSDSAPRKTAKSHTNVYKKEEEKPTRAYSAGQRVKHNVFGEGTVLSAVPMGNDSLLEVAFEKVGTKKIMANYAKMEVIE